MNRRSTCHLALVFTLLAPLAAARAQQPIGYVEDFALAEDRQAVLDRLIPGTEAFYFYSCLYHQQHDHHEKVDKLLEAWVKRHGHTDLNRRIEMRRALLRYDQQPRRSLDDIARRLGLHFNHQRQTTEPADLPSRLDQDLISRTRLLELARRRSSNTSPFAESSFDWLIRQDLDDDRLHHLLQRLKRPDYPGLAKLIVRDMRARDHRTDFGSMPIHKKLLRAQLDELLTLQPALLADNDFVNAYLARLRPGDDEDHPHDPAAKRAYLDRLWGFVQRLDPAFNSLKAHVLYRKLQFDRSRGRHDRELFMTYLKLPRRAGYVQRAYLRKFGSAHEANLNARFNATALPPIGRDEALVRSYLAHLFLQGEQPEAFNAWVKDDWLKTRHAETMLLHGKPDAEKWYDVLSPGHVERLKKRVDLDFAPTNPEHFAPDDQVELTVHVKNVPKLLVKVYRINAFNYYRDHGREVKTDINLDGLVANIERSDEIDQPPLRRVERTLTFPGIDDRGTYVVELIGGGKSSRALIRKGKLRFVVKDGPAGHVLRVFDEANRPVDDARVYLDGHHYEADGDGRIVVPYSTKAGSQRIILLADDFASLDRFDHHAEQYALKAGIYVDREQLIAGKRATAVIRPVLTLNGRRIPLGLLKNVSLDMTATDLDGITSTQHVDDLAPAEGEELTAKFNVPTRLRTLTLKLSARVDNVSTGETASLDASRTFRVNGIDQTDQIAAAHLVRRPGGYTVAILGRSGEAMASRRVNVTLHPRDFTFTVNATLATDQAGRIDLGPLEGIDRIQVNAPQSKAYAFAIHADGAATQQRVRHARLGEPIRIPWVHGGREPARDRVSLLETRDGTFVADHFDKLAIRSGYLIIEDLPAGTYDLAIKPTGRKISVRVTAGAARAGYAVSDAIYLELEPHQPLTVESIEQRDGALVIRTAGGSGLGRVHLLAGRYQPAFDTFGLLAAGPIDPPYAVNPPTSRSLYVEGRDIGDEYRYILDRRDAAKYPGNMLERPGLLLNPWAVRKTDAGLQQARGGSEYLREGEDSFGVGMYGVGGEARDVDGDLAGHASLDFLRHPAGVATNLVPDEHGMVRVPLDELGDRHHLHVVVVDGDQTVYRQAVLEPKDRQFVDLRLTGGLDPDKHYTQQQKITGLAEGESLTIDDPATAEVHAIDDLADAHQLLLTLTGDGKLDEWRFILDWPTLDEAEKRSKYSEYASHELHFFLYRKDRPFFDELVRPYLENKKDKTFLDHYLLGDDLSAYAEPWAFGRLNVAERALLARRLAEQRKHIERHILDRFELLPTDPARYDRLFRAALAGRALGPASDDGEGWGFELGGIGGKAQAKSQLAADRSSTRPAPTQPPAEPVTALGVAPADTGPADGRRREALARRERAARAADAERRKQRRFYRELPKTREWAENNYHHLPIGRQLADLVNVDAFWRDYVEREGDGPFLSPHFAFATDNFTEAMFVLALLDLPFEAAEHEQAADDGAATVTAGSPMVMLHRELLPVDPAHGRTPVLVSQNFFRPDDRFEQVDGERVDKFITGEFLVDVVYGCQVVLVNPTSSRQKLDVLTQVPQGAVPVAGARYTHTRPIGLEPYSTQRIEFHFYFPEAGEFRHYPVHAAKNGRLLAAAEPVTLRAVTELSDVDTTSWAYLSQRGSAEQVVEYLKTANLARIDLSRIAWRMKDAATFRRITDLLTRRHAYDHTLWSYSVKHDHLPALRQFLKHADGVVNRVGPYLASTPLTVDPVARHLYQHLEYAPLVNARAHQLGDRRKIVNDALHAQYEAFCGLLAHKPTLDDEDRMAAAYYLLLQDRIEQGLAWLGEVDPKRLATRLQYDYFQACAAFYREDLAAARRIADRYADHPVDRWRQRFAEVANQLDQIAGAADGVVRQDDQQQAQTELAATAPALDVRVEGGQVVVDYQNLEAASINYYLMDIELLFSRRPFVQDYGEQFAYIRPNRSTRIDLPDDRNSVTFDLPAALAGRNLVVEADARGRGHRASAVHLSSALRVNLIENYGQVQVTGRDDNKPRSKVYVKVYAQRADGSTRFYKDGYTDLRGRFDYLSLNTRQLGNAEKFSLLILSQTEGAVVREAAPPKQ